MRTKMATVLLFLWAGVIFIGSCRSGNTRPVVVTTLPDFASWVEAVSGERFEVTSLLTGGEDPHLYEPRTEHARLLEHAFLIVENGLGYDEWIDGLLRTAGKKDVIRLRVAYLVEAIEDEEDEEHHGHTSHPEGNPHIWLDPEVAKRTVGRLAEIFAEVDSNGRDFYQERARRYCEQLDSVVQRLRERVNSLSNRKFVALHNSWPYFCRAFGLEMVAAVEPLPGQEPSLQDLARIVELMRREAVRVVVVEPQHNRDVADALARETGAKVVVLGSITGSLPAGDSYINLLEYDINTLVAALRGAD